MAANKVWHSVQFGKLIIIVYALLPLLGAVLLLLSDGEGINFFLSIFILLPIVVISLFYKLEVYNDQDYIYVKLGIGILRRKIEISKVASVTSVINSPLAGWGIRLLPGYTLYNVTGSRAIEIRFLNKKRTLRIGMSEPDAFVKFFYENLKK